MMHPSTHNWTLYYEYPFESSYP